MIQIQIVEYADLRDNYEGLCVACGATGIPEVEPDAREYPCPECGRNGVYGVEEALLAGLIEIV